MYATMGGETFGLFAVWYKSLYFFDIYCSVGIFPLPWLPKSISSSSPPHSPQCFWEQLLLLPAPLVVAQYLPFSWPDSLSLSLVLQPPLPRRVGIDSLLWSCAVLCYCGMLLTSLHSPPWYTDIPPSGGVCKSGISWSFWHQKLIKTLKTQDRDHFLQHWTYEKWVLQLLSSIHWAHFSSLFSSTLGLIYVSCFSILFFFWYGYT